MSTKIPYVIFTFISMWSYNKIVLIYYYNGLDAHDCKWCTTICYSSWSSLGSSHFDHILCHTVLLEWGKVWKWVGTRLGWQLLKLSGHTYNLVASILVNNEQSLIESPLLWNQLLDSMYLISYKAQLAKNLLFLAVAWSGDNKMVAHNLLISCSLQCQCLHA